MTGRSRLIRTLALLALLGLASAHPTVVFGELVSEPRTPRPGEPFTLTLSLREPSGLGVPDAYVFAEFFPPGEPVVDGQGRRAEFAEAGEGVYQAEASLPEGGTWTLKLRDRTYRQEETNARLEFAVGADSGTGAEANPAFFEFVFPPTRTPIESVLTWLLWLVGLPLLVALVVTVIVLTGSKGQTGTAQGSKEQQSKEPGKRRA
jgi:hypothetical protein